MDTPSTGSPTITATLAATLPDPFERFVALSEALHPGPGCTAAPWARFAAYAGILAVGTPAEVARAIHLKADLLLRHTAWYGALATPLRFAVAASLVANDCTVRAFDHHLDVVQALLHAEHLHASNQVRTLLAVGAAILGELPLSAVRMARIAALHHAGTRQPWWRLNGDDLPLCLLLSYQHGTAAEIIASVDTAAAHLARLGLGDDAARRRGARLLALAPDGIPAACARAVALLRDQHLPQGGRGRIATEVRCALAVLPHPPARILATLERLRARLQVVDPDLLEELLDVLAGDLTFLTLVRSAPDGTALRDPAERAALFTALRQQYATSLILACDAMDEVQPLLALESEYPFPLAPVLP